MQKYKTYLLLSAFYCAVTLISASPVQAATKQMERLEKREETKLEVQERRETIQTNMATRAAERQEDRQERRDKIAENHAERLSKRFSFYYTRLSQVMKKLETRLKTMAGEGQDVQAAQAKLIEAKTALENAKKASDEAVAAFKAVTPAELTAQKELALAARDTANEARKEFVAAVALMKEALKLAKNN